MTNRLSFFLALFLFTTFLNSCNRSKMTTANEPEEENSKTSVQTCSLTESDNPEILGVIVCPDGSTMDIPRAKDGSDGEHGLNGVSCQVEALEEGALIACEDGSQAFIKHGQDGHSCSVSSVDTYASLIECTDGSKSLIDLSSYAQYSVSEIVDPCGDHPEHYDEILIKFQNGDILAYFEQGEKRFLTLIGPGSYRTTDQQQCPFQIDDNQNILF